MLIHEDRLFPADPSTRSIAHALYAHVRSLPIVSPHGHTQAAWFAQNEPFPDPAKLFVQPDHYVYRMLYSQGVSMEDLEIGRPEIKNPRKVWHIFASHYYLFRGTPTRMWLDYAFQELFGLEERLSEKTADLYYDTIAAKLQTSEFRPRALYERFHLEVLATTDSRWSFAAMSIRACASWARARSTPSYLLALASIVWEKTNGFASASTPRSSVQLPARAHLDRKPERTIARPSPPSHFSMTPIRVSRSQRNVRHWPLSAAAARYPSASIAASSRVRVDRKSTRL